MSALYRRYRPQDLAHVVGQRHVVRTLTNALEHERVRHAYLFAGPRGTGKTSLAKILGKSLNCQQADGPTTTPCLECESCRTIADGTALDVIEMDAASNRGIDDIREIRDRVLQQPVLGRRRVYILDEAHSLTTDAANALLKTLEEPPEHVVFILCTTEPHRLPETVRGRCQSFTFLRPTPDELVEVLARIAEEEGIVAEPDALLLIARHAGGSFRDAVSTLDQLASAGPGQLDTSTAQSILGTVDADALVGLVDAIQSGDAAAALRLLDTLVEGGQDLGRLIRDLLDHLRLVLLTIELGEPPHSAGLGSEMMGAVVRQAGAGDEATTVALIDGLLDADQAARSGGDVRLNLELLLVKAARPRADRSLDGALRRIEALEGGRPIPTPVAAEGPPAAAPPPTAPPITEPPELRTDAEPAASIPPPPPPTADTSPAPPEPEPAVDDPPTAQDPPTARDLPPTPPTGMPSPTDPDDLPDAGELGEIWSVVVDERLSPKLRSIVASARPLRIERGALVLGFPAAAQFQKNQTDREQNRSEIAAAVSAALGTRLRIVLETLPEEAPASIDPMPAAAAATPPADGPVEADAEDDDPHTREEEFVRSLVETFDASEEEIT